MRLKKIYEIADGLAPFSLSREWCELYDGYDNSGILLDCGEEISRILFSLDLSLAAIERAKQFGAQLIMTHHPAIYSPLKSLSASGEGKEILACARAGISVISAHLNLDCATDGIDESFMKGLGGEHALCVMERLSSGAYGRVFEVEETPFDEYVKAMKKTFQTQRITVYGNRPVKRVACFCGGGMDEKSVAFAAQNGADTFVSSDGKHHLVTAAVESGMNVLLLTHYASEVYGFHRYYEKIKEKSGVPCEFFTDERYL